MKKQAEYKIFITKRRSFTFYLSLLLVSALNSFYYCLILSMDKEIELITAKVYQSIVIFFLTVVEYFLFNGTNEDFNEQYIEMNKFTHLHEFSDKKYIFDGEFNLSRDLELTRNEEFDKKEEYFYYVIYGMLSFTSEILLYYFLSLSSSFGVNIGIIYSLTVIEYLILISRLFYFKLKPGFFQYLGVISIISLLSIIYYLSMPNYNYIVIIFTGLTVSFSKYIKYCIYEYVLEKSFSARSLIRNSSFMDAFIAFLLLFFILMSKKPGMLIDSPAHVTKIILASFLYFFAMKIAMYKEKNYYLYIIFSSFNFIFIILFDYILNRRVFTATEFILVTLLSFASIITFVDNNSFFEGIKKLKSIDSKRV